MRPNPRCPRRTHDGPDIGEPPGKGLRKMRGAWEDTPK